MGVMRRRTACRLFTAVLLGCMAMLHTFSTGVSAHEKQKPHVNRLRHSRHLEGFIPIRIPSTVSTTPPKLSVMDNHKPIFKECSNYRPVVKEEQPVGTYVFTVHAVDPDPDDAGGTVTYTFVTAAGEKDRFTIESLTGNVYTADIFDHDEPSREKEVYITVRVSDNGHPQLDDACTIRIIIEDINDNAPVFDKVSYSESVPQDLQVGREVMRISATDIDDGNNSIVHYSLDTNSPDQSYFIIDRDNGVIFLNKTIDKPPGYKFRLNAIVKDAGDPPQQSSITLDITVIESNKKSPSFIDVPEEPIYLKENYSDFNKPIAIIKATSNIPEEKKLQFELVQGQTEQTNKYHTFVMEPEADSAAIKLGNHLDFEKNTEYTLTVRIQNNYKLAAETIITVLVEDVNDNIPIFSEIRSGTVLENEPAGTPVMQVRAIDADGTSANNEVTYELGDESDPFAIDPVTGNITTLKKFDREQRSYYNIKIIATDNSESALIPGKHNSGQQVFLIEIADKNDNPPRFTQDTYIAESIAENANVNELVTQVTAVDNDTASRLKYAIVAGNTYDAFFIRDFTGEIRVNNELDYENITSYSLDVRAFDGLYEDYAKVIIKIENLNDNPPVFLNNYTKVIEEERLYEGCIVKVEAYDPDIKDRNAPQHIVYSLVKQEQMAFLDIDNDGCLRLTKPLDRDQPTGFQRWQILIVAADHGGKPGSDSLRSTTEVILELTDINDNAPFLTNSQPVIWYENEPPGLIISLTAKDYDSAENGPPFTFALDDHSADYEILSRFRIQGNGLYALTSFDREERKQYTVPVMITDSGTPRMTGVSLLHLIIGDRNDNPMGPGTTSVFVYNYKSSTYYDDLQDRFRNGEGDAPDMEVGRVYVNDPDDWDQADKKFMWLPNYESRSAYFDVHSRHGMVTMKEGTPEGSYVLRFNVSEQNEPKVPLHYVEAIVKVTVKNIPEVAVDRSGSIRFMNITAEEFILPEADGLSKKEKLHRRLSKLLNVTSENIDIFTLLNKQTVKDVFLDVRFSAHGSPYYAPERLNSMVTAIQDKLEDELGIPIFMVNINECVIEKEQCEENCSNILVKNNVPLGVYTNTTSFIGVTARTESECVCAAEPQLTVCLNGGTAVGEDCECPENYSGERCELASLGFGGQGWAMFPPLPTCTHGTFSMMLTAHNKDCLIFYMGPLRMNNYLDLKDFMALELVNGYPVLLVNYGSGTTRLNNSVVLVSDGKPHLIEIVLMKTSIEMFVDRCKMSTCMSLAAPTGKKEILNINAPIHIGGTSVSLKMLSTELEWKYTPSDRGLVGCISNMSYNGYMYDLANPSMALNLEDTCNKSMFTAVTFGIDTNFLIAILICIVVLIILLLAVVVHRRRSDAWAEKELDDIRENIIAYEDEGGGEGDAGYDLHVLRQMYEGPPPDNEGGFLHATAAAYCYNRRRNAKARNSEKEDDNTEQECVNGNIGIRVDSEVSLCTSEETAGFSEWSPASCRATCRAVPRITITEDSDIPTPPPPVSPYFNLNNPNQNRRLLRCPNSPKISNPSKKVVTFRLPGEDPEEYIREIPPRPNRAILPRQHRILPIPPLQHQYPRMHVPNLRPQFSGMSVPNLRPQCPPILLEPPQPLCPVPVPPPPHPLCPLPLPPPPQPMCPVLPVPPPPRPYPRTPSPEHQYTVMPLPPRLRGQHSDLRIDLPPIEGQPITYSTSPSQHHAVVRFRLPADERELEEGYLTSQLGLNSAAPDISGFLDDKKTVMDRDPETPYDDVRFYAYEGDGNTSGSLSSLASCTDDGDLNFNHLATFGPRFRKLADMYGDSDEEDRQPHEESWC